MIPDEPNNPNQTGDHPDVIEYFLPGQIVLQLKHPAGISEEEILRAFGNFLLDPEKGPAWRNRLQPPEPGDLLKFPQLNDDVPAFSTVRVRLANQEASKEELVHLLKAIYEDLTPEGDDYKRQLRPIPITPDSSIRLNSVAPNWSIVSGNHVPAFGSPGGWPKENPEKAGSWPQFQFSEPSVVNLLESYPGAGVHVAILDTAPCLQDLAEAYNEWAVHKKGEHRLLESLLGPDSPLHIYPASYEQQVSLADWSDAGHRYRMPDHGLFVAGILHTIAPQAQLHLFEVLNPYGVGSIETIGGGLLKVLELLNHLRQDGERQPMVVNCSLTLGVSADGQEDPDLPDGMRDPNLLEHTRISFEEMVALLDQPDSVVVAAAGNDASPVGRKPIAAGRPKARYPAAFQSVIGVGALPDHGSKEVPFQAASYSNLADEPPEAGYLTLGGEEVGKDEGGRKRGMRGIFISAYPQNKSGLPDRHPGIKPENVEYGPNENGWAFWAGTSFATPVVSGLLATWWSKDRSRDSSKARDFLDSLAGADKTNEGEKVILARQV